MLGSIWETFCEAFNLGGLFDIIKTIFYTVLIIIAIAILVAIVLSVITNAKEQEKREMEQKEKAEKKRKEDEFFARRKKYYLEGLTAIYDHRSTADLKLIHGYLTTMHYNDRYDDEEYNSGNIHRWADAREKLLEHLGYPKWKWLDSKGFGYTDSPILATEDMNYVYRLIQSRK